MVLVMLVVVHRWLMRIRGSVPLVLVALRARLFKTREQQSEWMRA